MGGYSFPSSSTRGLQVHHWLFGILSMMLGMCFPHPTHDSCSVQMLMSACITSSKRGVCDTYGSGCTLFGDTLWGGWELISACEYQQDLNRVMEQVIRCERIWLILVMRDGVQDGSFTSTRLCGEKLTQFCRQDQSVFLCHPAVMMNGKCHHVGAKNPSWLS